MKHEIHVTTAASAVDLRQWVDGKFPEIPGSKWRLNVHEFVNHATPPIVDVFTSEVCAGPLERVLHVAESRHSQIRNADLTPVRVKIEAEPWDHPMVAGEMYYESHVAILGAMPGAMQLGVKNLLISTNLRKRSMTATLRSSNCTLEMHMDRVNRAARGLLANKIAVLSVHHEVVVHDSNRGHDKEWEKSSG